MIRQLRKSDRQNNYQTIQHVTTTCANTTDRHSADTGRDPGIGGHRQGIGLT